MELDHDACYRALKARDRRFDGRFFVAVRTTGIYCRPICPARFPKSENCIFLPSAAAAHEAGFRPCLRCRPEVSPEVAGWRGTSCTVTSALRLIEEGALDENNIERLAARLGVGGRHLRRLFDKHLGASPIAVAQTRRILLAKRLLDETSLSMIEVALAAGFGSVRRFNDAMRRTYKRSPSELRGVRASWGEAGTTPGVTLKLPYSPPYDWPAVASFLGPRAIPGVESASVDCYRRVIAIDGGQGIVEVRPAAGADYLVATIWFPRVAALASIIGRLRRVFDLDADRATITDHLTADRWLAEVVAARPGLRVPGAWDDFELAVRAILGQQISVAAATRLAGRLAAAHGEPLNATALPGATPELRFAFPKPEALADADLADLGIPLARARAISALAAAVVRDKGLFQNFVGLGDAVARLRRLPGIGEWTAQYIAMRELREPDAFPAADIGLMRAMGQGRGVRPSPAELLAHAEQWRPWRAYAALHLWASDPQVAAAEERRVVHERQAA
jgi:AraC family transcriptional regulator, regulatory protein of adaptative response / DNA-3-methyladenine glycosylase II